MAQHFSTPERYQQAIVTLAKPIAVKTFSGKILNVIGLHHQNSETAFFISLRTTLKDYLDD